MEKGKVGQGLPPLASRVLRPLAAGMLLISAFLTLLAAAAGYPAASAAGKIWLLCLLAVLVYLLSATVIFLMLRFISQKYLHPLTSAVEEITQAAAGDLTGPASPIPCTTREVESLLKAVGEISEQSTACLTKMEEALRQMAAGDFTARVDCPRIRECGGVCAVLDGAVDRLRGAIGNIRTALEQLTGPLDVLEQDAAAMEESASDQQRTRESLQRSLDRLDMQMGRRSGNVEAVQNAAQSLHDHLDDYSHRQEELSKAIERITECAGAAAEIVSAMETASFQCSVLARTAYVEAAGAGINGKGFAVVASELRMLASRSAQSAQNAAAFMEEMNRTVRESATLAAAAVREADGLTAAGADVCRRADSAAQSASWMEELHATVRDATALDGIAEKDQTRSGNVAKTARLIKNRTGRLREALQAFKIN